MAEINTLDCEKEQLHLSGMIQSFGALIGVNKADLTISHASENIKSFVGLSAQELIGSKITVLSDQLSIMIDELEFDDNHRYITRSIKLITACSLRFSEDKNHIVIDIEEAQENDFAPLATSSSLRQAISPSNEHELQQLYANFVNEIKSLIRFDRVMIYQFQEDWSGIVIAEAAQSELGSYLDLRWPASDIPKIARDLYAINPSRIICDVEGQQVKILSNNQTPIDLTYSETRSVSPIHIQYLSNMGVKASFSISIMMNDRLWGLVACHHTEQINLAVQTKQKAIELTQQLRRSIQSYTAKNKLRHFDDREVFLNQVLKSYSKTTPPINVLTIHQKGLLDYILADGFAFLVANQIFCYGNTPSNDEILSIAKHLIQGSSETLQTQSIQQLGVLDSNYQGPPGVLAIHIKNTKGGSLCGFWFKKEVIQEVTWAGNPNKPLSEKKDAQTLSPRISFEEWVEIKRNSSHPFGQFDEGAARRFCRLMLEQITG